MALDLGGRGSAGKKRSQTASAASMVLMPMILASARRSSEGGKRPLEFGPAEESVVGHAASRSWADR